MTNLWHLSGRVLTKEKEKSYHYELATLSNKRKKTGKGSEDLCEVGESGMAYSLRTVQNNGCLRK